MNMQDSLSDTKNGFSFFEILVPKVDMRWQRLEKHVQFETGTELFTDNHAVPTCKTISLLRDIVKVRGEVCTAVLNTLNLLEHL